jgi:serine/threonine protein kinase
MTTIPARVVDALAARYRVEREIGAGGMATVYLAEDLKHHRRIALKVLKPELAAILGAERFLKEIEVTANLQHPNILPLYHSGEAGGYLYYVMPYIEGESQGDLGFDVLPGDSLFVLPEPTGPGVERGQPVVVVHNFVAELEARLGKQTK